MEKVVLLPGPVNIRKGTLKCLSRVPISHRSREFGKIFEKTRRALRAFTGARECAIFTGSGTLANEVVAARLSLLGGAGLVLSNGEFGERLAGQAARFSLKFEHMKYGWGESFDYAGIEARIKKLRPEWLWFAHFETSTCVLNDFGLLEKICRKYGVKLCADLISSIGNVNLDLSGAYLAAASSGKGLACLAGLGIVFSNHSPQPDERLPKYLDYGFNLAKGGIPFTISSNHVIALERELSGLVMGSRLKKISEMGGLIRAEALKSGFKIIGGQDFMMTLELPHNVSSFGFGDWFARKKIEIHYKSDYLAERNWVQVALMGYPPLSGVLRFTRAMRELCSESGWRGSPLLPRLARRPLLHA